MPPKILELSESCIAGLVARRNLVQATAAMRRLNMTAPTVTWKPRRNVIYGLKNRFVEMLCKRGHCIGVNLVEQRLPCWHTPAFDDGLTDHCVKCNDTGVYRSHLLYKFTFEVGDLQFVWHQPYGLVDWPVELDLGTETWTGRREGVSSYQDMAGQDAWAVWWCLFLRGRRAPMPLELFGLSARALKPSFVWHREYTPRHMVVYFLSVRAQFRWYNRTDWDFNVAWPYVPADSVSAWSPGWIGVFLRKEKWRRLPRLSLLFGPYNRLKRRWRDTWTRPEKPWKVER